MAETHRELVNNNVLFVDEGSQEQKTLQKWHYNDANEVRDLNILLNSKPCFKAHKLGLQLLTNTIVNLLSPTSHEALRYFILEQYSTETTCSRVLQPVFDIPQSLVANESLSS